MYYSSVGSLTQAIAPHLTTRTTGQVTCIWYICMELTISLTGCQGPAPSTISTQDLVISTHSIPVRSASVKSSWRARVSRVADKELQNLSMFSTTHSTFARKLAVLLAGFSTRNTARLGLRPSDSSLSNKRMCAPCPWGVSGRRTSCSEPGIRCRKHEVVNNTLMKTNPVHYCQLTAINLVIFRLWYS